MVSSTVSAVFLNNVLVLLTHKNLAGSFHLSEPGTGVAFRSVKAINYFMFDLLNSWGFLFGFKDKLSLPETSS